MIHMYGIHRMREKNVVRYSFHVPDSFTESVCSGPQCCFREGGFMLWTIFVMLLVLWLLGLISSYTLGGYIHILLVVALVVLVINLATGRRGAV